MLFVQVAKFRFIFLRSLAVVWEKKCTFAPDIINKDYKQHKIMAKKALLMILDGWVIGKHGKGDVIFNTPTPYLDYLTAVSAHSQLQASG